jgi:hypothetical protein
MKIYFGILIFFLSSCKWVVEKKFHMNQKFRFKSVVEYQNHLLKKGFDTSSVLFLPANKYNDFALDYFFGQTASPYIATFINDSIKIKKSEVLSENLGCMGRILKDVNNQVQDSTESQFEAVKKQFSSYSFQQFGSNSDWTMSLSKKRFKIILVYSYSFGTYYNDTYKELLLFQRQNEADVDVFIISIDNLNTLKR